jgi:BlaI family penicillinase repressor
VTDPKLATVQKLTERLEAKGCVERDRSERAHRFRPLVSREQYLRSRLQSLADRLCDGALVPLVTTLLRSKGISRNDRKQLRKLIGELWPSKEIGARASK